MGDQEKELAEMLGDEEEEGNLEEESEEEENTAEEEEGADDLGDEEENEEESNEEGGEGDEEEREDEVDPRDVAMAEMSAALASMQARLDGTSVDDKSSKAKDKSTDDKADEGKEVNYLDGVDMDELSEKPEVLNKILNKAVANAVDRGKKLGTEEVLKSLPTIVAGMMQQQSTNANAVAGFYKENVDLAKYKPLVKATASEVATKNPEITQEELFKKTGELVRKRLGLKAKATSGKGKGGKGKKPFSKVSSRQGGGKQPKKKATGMGSEIDSMMVASGRN